MQEKITLSIITVLMFSTTLTIPFVNADTDNHDKIDILSPKVQMTQGVLPEDIVCREGLILAIRVNGESVCVTEKMANKLNWQIIITNFPQTTSKIINDKSNETDRCFNLNKGAVLIDCNFRGMDLHKKNLSRVDFSGSDLSGSDLSGANMMDAKFVNANLKNTKISNAYLMNANFEGADLSGANFSESDLSGANINGTKVYAVNLYKVNLSGAFIVNTNLSTANLSYAKLDDAWLVDVNLVGANLTGVNVNTMYFDGLLIDHPGFNDRYILK